MPPPESLLAPGLDRFWAAVRGLVDRAGAQRPRTVARPPLDPSSQRALRSLLGAAYRGRIELDALERELVARGVGCDLDEALAVLGHPRSDDAIERRAEATRRREARQALDAEVDGWTPAWAAQWAADLAAGGGLAGLEPGDVRDLASDVARVVGLVTSGRASRSRVDVAVSLFGDSHGLDDGLRRTAWVKRALRFVVGDLDGRELWNAAGLLHDRVSGPALVWGLEATGDGPAADLLATARRHRVPVHLSQFVLEHGLTVAPGARVLVAENPRVVEFAAERDRRSCVIAANGYPSIAVQTLIELLVSADAEVFYHGDFDPPGLAMCAQMIVRGCRPWLMDAADYADALETAAARGVRLGRATDDCADTPWDPPLATLFNRERAIVHEEFVLGDLALP